MNSQQKVRCSRQVSSQIFWISRYHCSSEWTVTGERFGQDACYAKECLNLIKQKWDQSPFLVPPFHCFSKVLRKGKFALGPVDLVVWDFRVCFWGLMLVSEVWLLDLNRCLSFAFFLSFHWEGGKYPESLSFDGAGPFSWSLPFLFCHWRIAGATLLGDMLRVGALSKSRDAKCWNCLVYSPRVLPSDAT